MSGNQKSQYVMVQLYHAVPSGSTPLYLCLVLRRVVVAGGHD